MQLSYQRLSGAPAGPARSGSKRSHGRFHSPVVTRAAAAVEQAVNPLTQKIVEEEAKYVLQTYGRPNLVFVKGEGCKLYDADGKEYLDMAAGKNNRCLWRDGSALQLLFAIKWCWALQKCSCCGLSGMTLSSHELYHINGWL